MLRRILWLALIGAAGWLAWVWLRQRQEELAHPMPHFEPPGPSERPIPPAFAPPPAASTSPKPSAKTTVVLPRHPDLDQPPAETREQVAERVPGAAEGGATVSGSGASEADSAPSESEAADITDASPQPLPVAVPSPAISTASENERASIEASSASASTDARPLEQEVSGYCVRCKTKRVIQGAHEETTETGRRAARGVCPVCGANMFTFLKDDDEGQEAKATGK